MVGCGAAAPAPPTARCRCCRYASDDDVIALTARLQHRHRDAAPELSAGSEAAAAAAACRGRGRSSSRSGSTSAQLRATVASHRHSAARAACNIFTLSVALSVSTEHCETAVSAGLVVVVKDDGHNARADGQTLHLRVEAAAFRLQLALNVQPPLVAGYLSPLHGSARRAQPQ